MLSLQKWQIVKWSTIAIAIAFSLILFANGINENIFRIAIRFTARCSCTHLPHVRMQHEVIQDN
ncbi:hypothetical protein I4641_11395 [Waterburya agarophytonicola K14]|uniref:Uncharacterized protein n=1 Tax=Waterburya agarophytonicola KI4 TaxID=2874699 RepID=A0A964FFY3_9CYAN|nr:hypothetical protein [Waterburya agarophytonicola]MCC0177582.1 hypothetical protein [Waterburya agarophytonicola KI4]